MNIHNGFAPDAARAIALDRRMHQDLARSVQHIVDQVGTSIEFDRRTIARLISRLDQGLRASPETFACYYALADALLDGDSPRALKEFAALARQPVPAAGRLVAPLRPAEQCERSRRYLALLADEGNDDVPILAPTPEVAARFGERFDRGLELMRRAVPELAGEVEAIVHEVVPIAGDPAADEQIDGGSHFQLWGALFLNAGFHPTDASMFEVIAHESAHSLLFALCRDEMLVDNDDEEVYPSPLRSDLRPMDGIYHATFVSARMHWAMSGLLASGLADPREQAAIAAARDDDLRNFQAGLSVIDAHAQLTSLGRELMEGARRYIASVH